MDVEISSIGGGGVNCSCSCPYCGSGSQPSSLLPRTLKRKLEQMEENNPDEVARVEIEIEAAALRDALANQQESIQGLCAELEEERTAASTAASEAMSMILRLQRDKAESQMDARQFKLLAEEKMSHGQQEIAVLEDLLFKRDEALKSLSCELLAYRHRLLSYGIDPVPTEPNFPTAVTAATNSRAAGGGSNAYPPLRCELADFKADAAEKGVIENGHSPSWAQRAVRRLSNGSFGSPSFQQEFGSNEFPSMADRSSYTCDDGKEDEMADRVYTMDAVHGVDEMYGGADMSTPREFSSRRDASNGAVDEGEIKRLYMRLQALEADRESMRQAIMTMGTDKAQKILLKEIARQLHKEAVPEKRIVKKPSFLRSFSVMSVFKVIYEIKLQIIYHFNVLFFILKH